MSKNSEQKSILKLALTSLVISLAETDKEADNKKKLG